MTYFLLLALTWSSISFAQSNKILEQAQKLLNQAKYSQAQIFIQKQIINFNAKNKIKLYKLYWLLGICYTSKQDQKKAIKIFNKLLTIRPDFFPSAKTSPKLQNLFEKARKNFFRHDENLSRFIPKHSANITSKHLQFSFAAPSKTKQFIKTIRLYFRTPNNITYRSITAKNGTLIIPKTLINAELIYYYIEFIGFFDRPFMFIGTENLPKKFRVNFKNKNNSTAITKKNQKYNHWPSYLNFTFSCLSIIFYLLFELTVL